MLFQGRGAGPFIRDDGRGGPTANASGHRRADHRLQMSPQQAIEAPRWLQGRMLDLSQPGTLLNLEGRVRDDVVLELRRLGIGSI